MIWAIVIGFVVGFLAKLLMPGKDPGGFIITTLLGIAGSLLAAFIGRSFGWYLPGESAGFFASLMGAILLLIIYRVLKGPTHTQRHSLK